MPLTPLAHSTQRWPMSSPTRVPCGCLRVRQRLGGPGGGSCRSALHYRGAWLLACTRRQAHPGGKEGPSLLHLRAEGKKWVGGRGGGADTDVRRRSRNKIRVPVHTHTVVDLGGREGESLKQGERDRQGGRQIVCRQRGRGRL